MNSIFLPFKDVDRPDIELFTWKVITFFILLSIATGLFYSQLYEMHMWKKVACGIVLVTLSCQTLYNLFLLIYFKTLKYEIADEFINIKTLLFNKKICFADIKSIENVSGDQLKVNRKVLFSYKKDTMDLIYPIGQLGVFDIENIGQVHLYSTDFLDNPKNLILIRTLNGTIFGLSPDNKEEFIKSITRP